MRNIWRSVKGFIISLLYRFVEKEVKYDVGCVRAFIKFTNGKACDITIVGEINISREAMNNEGVFTLEHSIDHAVDRFHSLLEKINDRAIDFIVGDDKVYYRLDINEVDEIKLMETISCEVVEVVYDKVRK